MGLLLEIPWSVWLFIVIPLWIGYGVILAFIVDLYLRWLFKEIIDG
ncbi:MAG: hypothetical protein PHN44_10675 [Candidatus Marinimicrobia bacterium]|jgi:hypothetical protein|nr:hypothetical protein [Candidatus Neomarinimicrobiota bacterium]